jgi:hypothetical protein
MGLVLAFALSLALARYEARRADVVDDANRIGTAYLRAQTLAEPMRSQSLPLLVEYTGVELRLTLEVPGSSDADRTIAEGDALQRQLWALAAQAVREQPTASAPRLYEESLNDMIDQQTVRAAGLVNRVPTEVLMLEIIGSALAMFLLGLHVGFSRPGRRPAPARGRSRDDVAVRHLRPRSPDSRSHQGPGRAPRRTPRLHG